MDAETLDLRFSGRPEKLIRLVEAYTKEQGLFHTASTPEAADSDALELDLSTVEPSLAGPKRPQDRVRLGDVKQSFAASLPGLLSTAKTKSANGQVDLAIAKEIAEGSPSAAAVPANTPTVRTCARSALRSGRGHRRDHQLHEHQQSLGDDRGRPAGEKGRRAGLKCRRG